VRLVEATGTEEIGCVVLINPNRLCSHRYFSSTLHWTISDYFTVLPSDVTEHNLTFYDFCFARLLSYSTAQLYCVFQYLSFRCFKCPDNMAYYKPAYLRSKLLFFYITSEL
jgi:hypothetical protein